MKIWLRIEHGPEDTEQRRVREPYPGCDHAIADGACPQCGAAPFKVAGRNQRTSTDDRAYEADGACLACKASVGLLRAECSTLFGVSEDRAVYELCQRHGIRIY